VAAAAEYTREHCAERHHHACLPPPLAASRPACASANPQAPRYTAVFLSRCAIGNSIMSISTFGRPKPWPGRTTAELQSIFHWICPPRAGPGRSSASPSAASWSASWCWSVRRTDPADRAERDPNNVIRYDGKLSELIELFMINRLAIGRRFGAPAWLLASQLRPPEATGRRVAVDRRADVELTEAAKQGARPTDRPTRRVLDSRSDGRCRHGRKTSFDSGGQAAAQRRDSG
jgi:hypothetical protein